MTKNAVQTFWSPRKSSHFQLNKILYFHLEMTSWVHKFKPQKKKKSGVPNSALGTGELLRGAQWWLLAQGTRTETCVVTAGAGLHLSPGSVCEALETSLGQRERQSQLIYGIWSQDIATLGRSGVRLWIGRGTLDRVALDVGGIPVTLWVLVTWVCSICEHLLAVDLGFLQVYYMWIKVDIKKMSISRKQFP